MIFINHNASIVKNPCINYNNNNIFFLRNRLSFYYIDRFYLYFLNQICFFYFYYQCSPVFYLYFCMSFIPVLLIRFPFALKIWIAGINDIPKFDAKPFAIYKLNLLEVILRNLYPKSDFVSSIRMVNNFKIYPFEFTSLTK